METPILISCVKNDLKRLPFFLEYYRKLGIKEFVMIDNNSVDGSYEYLETQAGVVLYLEKRDYRECNHGVRWINETLNRHAKNRWALTVDTDEFFAYPSCEKHDISHLISFLESRNYEAFAAPMLDMYANAPLGDIAHEPGDDLILRFPYFDSGPYQHLICPGVGKVINRGGVRFRLFERGFKYRGNAPPVLKKIPLVKWDGLRQYKHSTHVFENAKLSPMTGVLLHFNLLGDIRALQCDKEYPRHLLRFNPYFENTVEYTGSKLLVELGLIYDAI